MRGKQLFAYAAVLLCFLLALSGLSRGQRREGARQLEQAVRRTAAGCYASEGFYPPSVDYMVAHCGLQYNGRVYTVHYEVFASNLMPEITVLEKLP